MGREEEGSIAVWARLRNDGGVRGPRLPLMMKLSSTLYPPAFETHPWQQTTGGELLFIECSLVQGGRGTLTITGKLGEVGALGGKEGGRKREGRK